MTVIQSDESKHNDVYGETFALYNKKEMLEFIHPFNVRFERNNLDKNMIFKDKACLDAGCGNGRGTLFMLQAGAKSVKAYDYSRKNIETTKKFVDDFGFSDKVTCNEGSLEQIPFKDEEFDFVWCNGVIMHTKSPNKCLAEISRVLKVNGQCWLYIYGSGGIYWKIIYFFRDFLKNVDIDKCINALKLFRYSTRFIAEYIDDWYTPYLRTYTNEDLSARLESLGFEKPTLLKYGVDYDTSHRINNYASETEKILMGEGDLRYLLSKSSNSQSDDNLISEGGYGSEYNYDSLISENVDPILKKLVEAVGIRDLLKIASAAQIQRELRILLSEQNNFSIEKITSIIKETISCIRKI